MVRLNKIQQCFTNVKSANTEIKLGIPELPTGSAMMSETPGPEILGKISEPGVIQLLTRKHKWKQEESRMFWKCYFESDKCKSSEKETFIQKKPLQN